MSIDRIKTLKMAFLVTVSFSVTFFGTALSFGEDKAPVKQPEKLVTATKKGTTFKILWDYDKFPAKLELYELKNPKFARVGGMGRLKSKISGVLANQIKAEEMFVPDGDSVKFAVVVENTSKKKIYFHVVPHEITPAEYSLGTKFNCLCMGHIYSVAPGHVWYRIVSLQNATPQLGHEFTIRHKVIGIDGDSSFSDAKEFQEE
jgi:hypothetical protein